MVSSDSRDRVCCLEKELASVSRGRVLFTNKRGWGATTGCGNSRAELFGHKSRTSNGIITRISQPDHLEFVPCFRIPYM